MKRCHYCGSKFDDMLSYCPNCGAATATESEKETEQTSNAVKINKNMLIAILSVAVIVFAAITVISVSKDNKSGEDTSVSQNTSQTATARSFAENEQNNIADANNVNIVSVSASSYDIENSYSHDASKIFDNNFKSCWAEGVAGMGIGEYISVQFNGMQRIHGFSIWAGHQKRSDLFYKNGVPVSLSVIAADGTTVNCTIQDSMGEQRITFDHPLVTDTVKIVINDVRDGSRWQDTCITEMKFF